VPKSSNQQHSGSRCELTSLLQGASKEDARGELVFLKAEDEALHARCSWACSWAVPQDGRFESQVAMRRVLFCVDRKRIGAAVKVVAALFDHDLQQHAL
jgi:hypothetical protein